MERPPPMYEVMYYAIRKLPEGWPMPGDELYLKTKEDEEKLFEITLPGYGFGPSEDKTVECAINWVRHQALVELKNIAETKKNMYYVADTLDEVILDLRETIVKEVADIVAARILVVLWMRKPRAKEGVIVKKGWWREYTPSGLEAKPALEYRLSRLDSLRKKFGKSPAYINELHKVIDEIISSPWEFFTVPVEKKEITPHHELIYVEPHVKISFKEFGLPTEDIKELQLARKKELQILDRIAKRIEAAREYGATSQLIDKLVKSINELVSVIRERESVMKEAKIEQQVTGVPKEEFCKILEKAITDVELRIKRKGRFLEMWRIKWLEINAIPVDDLIKNKEWIPLVEKVGKSIGYPPPENFREVLEKIRPGELGLSFSGGFSFSDLFEKISKMTLAELKEIKETLPPMWRRKLCEEIQKQINKLEKELNEMNNKYMFIMAFSNFVERGDIPIEEVESDWWRYFKKIADSVGLVPPERFRFKPSKDPREQKIYEETKEFLINLVDSFAASLMRETPMEALEKILDFDKSYFESLQEELRRWYDRKEWLCSDVEVKIEETGEVIPAEIDYYLNRLPNVLVEYAGGEDEAFEKVQEIIGYKWDDYASDRVLYDELIDAWRKYCR